MGVISAISDILGKGTGGILTGAKDIIDKFVTTDKERAELELQKLAEDNRHNEVMAAQIAQLVEQEVRDRSDARAREIAILNSGNATWLSKNIQNLLALFTLIATFVCWGMVCFGDIPSGNVDSVKDFRDFLTIISTGIIWYYFGSNSKSAVKDQRIIDAYESKK